MRRRQRPLGRTAIVRAAPYAQRWPRGQGTHASINVISLTDTHAHTRTDYRGQSSLHTLQFSFPRCSHDPRPLRVCAARRRIPQQPPRQAPHSSHPTRPSRRSSIHSRVLCAWCCGPPIADFVRLRRSALCRRPHPPSLSRPRADADDAASLTTRRLGWTPQQRRPQAPRGSDANAD